ncbi:hypothetical protein PRZ48_000185 [Zasmidium cellare]|uniref:Uncharacterized protein n=1 Tax=Zasmidium cellare TaxID=395010 RepID=A0ABR0F044_ZASCE|nr:hypothetical protein PRZ48_000185 [Zasmidium cellare]
MADPLRNVAAKLALAKIDANLGQDITAQRMLLEELIAGHEPPLSYTDLRKHTEVPYTSEKLRQHLMSLVKGTTTSAVGTRKGTDIFKYGSEVLTAEYLLSIGYTKASPATATAQPTETRAEDVVQDSTSTSSEVGSAGQAMNTQNSSLLSSPPSGLLSSSESEESRKRKRSKEFSNDENLQLPRHKKSKTDSRGGMEESGTLNDQPLQQTQGIGTAATNVEASTATSARVKRTLDETDELAEVSSPKRQRSDVPASADQETTGRDVAESQAPQEVAPQLASSEPVGAQHSADEAPMSVPLEEQDVAASSEPVQQTIDVVPQPARTDVPSDGDKAHEEQGMSKSTPALTAQDPEIEKASTLQDENTQPVQKDDQMTFQYEELKTKYEELKSHNESLHAERDLWECKYKDLLQMSIATEAGAKAKAKATEPVAIQKVDDLRAWTEKETDQRKRRHEIGLPCLQVEFEASLIKPINADTAWPRPHHENPDMRGILGNLSSAFDRDMDRLESSIQRVCGFYCFHNDAFSAAASTSVVVSDPEPALERIYETFFGSEIDKSWRVEAKAALRDPVHGFEFFKGILGAAVHEMVLSKPLPWDTASNWFDKLQPVAPYWNAAMKRMGCKNFELDDIVWSGLRAQIDSATFKNRVLMPRAKILADQLELVLSPQLRLSGITGSKEFSHTEFWNNSSANLTQMFMDALILKYHLEASPFEYEFRWPSAGVEFNFEEMDTPIGSQPFDKGIVAKATTPILMTRCYVYGKKWCVHCKAQGVEFRPNRPR